MSKKTTKALKEYYTSYYNSNFLRDYRYIYKDEKEHNYNDILHEGEYKGWDNSEKKALYFLTKKYHKGHDGDLFYTLSYYKDLKDFHKKDNDSKYSDRLFFDFDIKDVRVSNIKDKMSDVYNSSMDVELKQDLVSQLKEEFRNLILDEDLIYDVFVEASRLCDYLESIDLKPFLIFSGSKGFHINIFFKEMQLNQISNISCMLFDDYQQKLGLKYLDINANKGAIGKSQRVQYAYHSSTDLLTQPISRECSYDDVLSVIEQNKRKPVQFNLSDYIAPTGFSDYLVKLNNDFNIKADLELMENNVEQQVREEKRKNVKFKDYNNEPIDIDMRDLVRAYGIDGKDRGDRISVKCPFNDENNPSAVVFEERFHCSACNITYNYYDFISEMEHITDAREIIKIARTYSR